MKIKMRVVGKEAFPQPLPCKVCKGTGGSVVVAQQAYFSMLFLPWFPTGLQLVQICNDCRRNRTLRPGLDTRLPRTYEQIHESIAPKPGLFYFFGPIVAGSLAIVAGVLFALGIFS